MKFPLLLILSLFFTVGQAFAKSDQEIDSLKALLAKETDPCKKLQIQGEIANYFSSSNETDTFEILMEPLLKSTGCSEFTQFYIHRYRSDTFFNYHYEVDSAIYYNNLASETQNLSKNASIQVRLRKGLLSSLTGNFDDAIEIYPDLIKEIYKEQKFEFTEFLIRIYLNALFSKSKFPKLEEKALEFLEYDLKEKNDVLKAVCYYYLASSSYDAHLMTRTKEYNEQALHYARIAQEPHSLMGILALSQQIFTEENQFDKVKSTLIELDSLAAVFGIRQELYQQTNWASYFQSINQLDSAIERCQFIIDYPEAVMLNPIAYYYAQASIGELFLVKEKYTEAIEHLEIARAFYEEQGMMDELRRALYRLARSHYRLKNIEMGDFYLDKSDAIRDSLFNEDIKNKLSEQEIRFKTKEKEAQLEAKELLLSEKQLVEKQQNRTIWIISASLILMVVLVFFILRNRKALQSKQVQLEQSSKEIAAKNEENELLLKEIHHRVKNNLQIIMSLLDLQSMKLSDGESKDVLLSSQSRIKSMSLIHEELYQQDQLSVVQFHEYVKKLSNNIVDMFDIRKEFKLLSHTEPCKLDVVVAIPIALIINEVLTNSLKYGKVQNREPQIEVGLKKQGDQFELEIKDNGPGMNLEEQKSTLGMRIIKRLSKQIDAKYNFESTELGTRFRLIIPKI